MPNGMKIWKSLTKHRITEKFIENPTKNGQYGGQLDVYSESINSLRFFSIQMIAFDGGIKKDRKILEFYFCYEK